MSRNGKETKIPALTEVEAKQVEKIRSSINECINGLAKAISDMESLVKKNTTSKDLKEFNKWLLGCHDGFSSFPLESLEFDLNGILTDIESRSYYQKVYRSDILGMNYDYVHKEDLETEGFFKCPSCGAWLFDSKMDCPECGRKSKIIYLENERFFSEPFKIETGLRIEPSLLNFEEIAEILRKHTPVDDDGNVLWDERVNIADDTDEDGWPEIGNDEGEEDAWVNCSECPDCCECSGCMGFEDADDFEKCIEEQVIENYGKAMVALEDLQLAVAEMAIGPHINNAKANPVRDFAESVYYGWVYNTFFGDDNSYYNLPTILHQLQTSMDELRPHLNNSKRMVMAKVYEQIDTGEEIEEFSRTKYIPLEEAQETARICPNCGMWIDNELNVCDCGEWLEPVVDTERTFDFEPDVQIDREDFNDYVEWLVEKKGNQAAFEYVARVYQKDMSIVGDWVQKLGEELASSLKKED